MAMFHILYNFTETAFGGANQFLKALRAELVNRNIYVENPYFADVIIYSSYFFRAKEFYEILFKIKACKRKIIFIHRLDGSLRLTRNDNASRIFDQAVVAWAKIAADGVVFQNKFCMEQQYAEGMPTHIAQTVIGNAPDPAFFYPTAPDYPVHPRQLVYTSWSANIQKGFSSLRWLDEHLDYSRYAMTFVGNIPPGFSLQNIQIIPPQSSAALADILRRQHIFVGLSHNEPCSNAILEAMHCGLPVLIRNNGGNSEFAAYGGVTLYECDEDILPALEVMCTDYAALRMALYPPSISNIADRYIEFAEQLLSVSCRKHISIASYMRFSRQFTSVIPFSPIKFLFDHVRGRHNV